MSSYQLAERFDVRFFLFYGLALPLYRGAVAIENAWRFIRAALPDLLFWLAIVVKALALVALVAVVVAVVALVPVSFWAGLALIGVGGWATYPRGNGPRNGW